ncbi:cytochrome P450 [Xylariaceae sp. FL1019]|nr:cytochrome P450 [Xylariaceae sp. FL1019]
MSSVSTEGTIATMAKYLFYLVAPMLLLLIVYNLFFHPLKSYPGPFLAKITYGYGGYHAITGLHHLNTYKNFMKYGPVYREAPNRLMFNTLTAVQQIYYNPNITKAQAYRHAGTPPRVNLFNVRDNAEHRRKRKVIGSIVSDKSLRSFSPVMIEQIDILLQQLLKACQQGQYVNMSVVFNRLGVDVVGHLAFGCALKTQTETRNRLIPETMFSSIYLNNIFYTWPLLAHLSPIIRWSARKKVETFTGAVARMIAERTLQPVDSKHDFYSVVNGDGGLHQDEVWSEALFFVLAGGSTVATSMCGAMFHLSRHADAYRRLATEIRTTFTSGRSIQLGPLLASCAYLRAVIDESIRLTPPSPSPLWREPEVALSTTDQTFIVDGHVIPPGTEVGVHLWAILHDPEHFKDPFAFVPERWLPVEMGDEDEATEEEIEMMRETKAHMRRAHVVFGLGDRGCAGRSMAYMEASIAIAKIVWYFDFEKAAGDAGKLGCGRGGKYPWESPDQFQIFDVLGADHDGPNMVFKPRGEYWKDLLSDSHQT